MFFKDQIVESINTVKETATSVNKVAKEYSEEVYTEVIASSKDWKSLGKKAYKGGKKLAAKQQKMTFKALEEVKGQLNQSSARFKKIVQK